MDVKLVKALEDKEDKIGVKYSILPKKKPTQLRYMGRTAKKNVHKDEASKIKRG